MVNDDVNNKAINIEIKVAQYSAKAILKAMKKIIEDAAEKMFLAIAKCNFWQLKVQFPSIHSFTSLMSLSYDSFFL